VPLSKETVPDAPGTTSSGFAGLSARSFPRLVERSTQDKRRVLNSSYHEPIFGTPAKGHALSYFTCVAAGLNAFPLQVKGRLGLIPTPPIIPAGSSLSLRALTFTVELALLRPNETSGITGNCELLPTMARDLSRKRRKNASPSQFETEPR
jgi:hypothetical protein